MKDETTIQGLSISDGLFADTRGDRCLLSVCKAACCRNGIWVDAEHAATIRSRAAEIRPHLPTDRGGADSWFESDEFMDHADFPSGRGIPTAVVDDPEEPGRDACVFLRPDYLCALQCRLCSQHGVVLSTACLISMFANSSSVDKTPYLSAELQLLIYRIACCARDRIDQCSLSSCNRIKQT